MGAGAARRTGGGAGRRTGTGRRKPARNARTGEIITYSVVKGGLKARDVQAMIGEERLKRSDVEMVIPRRTFERRCAEDQDLRLDEADAVARLLRVREHARRAFGGETMSETWLSAPNPALGDEVPIRMARTDVGAREVEAVLTRFEHGVFG